MSTDVKVASRSLVMMGHDPISALTEVDAVNNLFEDVVESAMTNHRWRFCTGQQQMPKLAADPEARWDSAYQSPTKPQVLMIHAVTVIDKPIKFEIYEDMIFTNTTSDDVVVADFTFRAVTPTWPPYFKKALQLELAAIWAGALAQNGPLADSFEERALKAYAEGRRLDGQSRSTKPLRSRRLIDNRR